MALVAYIFVATFLPAHAWAAFVCLALLILAAVAVSGLPMPKVLKRALPALLFALFITLGALPEVTPSGNSFIFGLRIGEAGVERFTLLLVRTALCALIIGLYIAVTPFTDTISALRRFKVPAILTTVLALLYRYLFVLVEEARRLQIARDSRTLQVASLRHLGKEAKVFGAMVGNLFLRAYDRSERIYQAMLARGYDGDMVTLTGKRSFTHRDIVFGLIWGFSLVSILLLAQWL